MNENWDDVYSAADRVWSGNPNDALIAEAAALLAGTALDVGCGEGADAVWLARQGWRVSALDVSEVALARARAAADAAEVSVEWIHAGLIEAALTPASFDLVSACYPALPKRDDRASEAALMAAVRPGGVLLFVHHENIDSEAARAHGHEPDDYVSPDDVVAALTPDWTLQIHEQRPRDVREGAGRHHVNDVVVRARRDR